MGLLEKSDVRYAAMSAMRVMASAK